MQRSAQAWSSSSAAAQTLARPRLVSGLQELSHYSGVLLDQFGVLHDGQKPYPQAIEAVSEMARLGAQIYVLSNSSRRSGGTIDKLARMGFNPSSFAGAVTSGELAYQYIVNRPSEWWRTLGRRVLHINWAARGPTSLDGLNLEVVDSPEDMPDFILVHGTEALGSAWGRPDRPMTLEQLRQVLVRAADTSRISGRPIPMIVANPDLVTVDGDDLIVMPGTLARIYSEQGGVVQLMGKPDPLIYKAALAQMGLAGQEGKVLAIGDSLEHDIAGAAAAGIDSLFIGGGIHARPLQVPKPGEAAAGGDAPDMTQLELLCAQYNAVPQFVCSYLRW